MEIIQPKQIFSLNGNIELHGSCSINQSKQNIKNYVLDKKIIIFNITSIITI
jgi:hypothetical protein